MIVRLDEAVRYGDLFGNKGRNLSRMIQEGLQVPQGACISYQHHMDYLDGKVGVEDLSRQALQLMEEVGGLFSVRSSADVEDSSARSYAGQFRTLLDVPKQEVGSAIMQVYGSAGCSSGYFEDNVRMGVIIQKMVKGDFSGVIFTHNLIDNDPGSIMMEISGRRCEDVVGGLITPSLYVIDKATGEIVLSDEGEEHIALDRRHIEQILYNSCRIEEIFGRPQDIEMVMQGYTFNCLQSRDITTIR